MSEIEEKPRHAFFSRKAAFQCGSTIWQRADGSEVDVTAVFYTADIDDSRYGWPDRIYVGEVTRMLRDGMQGDPSTAMLDRRIEALIED